MDKHKMNSAKQQGLPRTIPANDGAQPSARNPKPSSSGGSFGCCVQASTSSQNPDGALAITDCIKNMDNKGWKAIQKGLLDPVPKAEFSKMCKDIVHIVSQSTARIVVPALKRMMATDQESKLASDTLAGSSKGIAPPQTPLAMSCVVNKHNRMAVKSGSLVDVVPKQPSSSSTSWSSLSQAQTKSSRRLQIGGPSVDALCPGSGSVNRLLKPRDEIRIDNHNVKPSAQRRLSKLDVAGSQVESTDRSRRQETSAPSDQVLLPGSGSLSWLANCCDGITIDDLKLSAQESLSQFDILGLPADLSDLNFAIVNEVIDTVNSTMEESMKMLHSDALSAKSSALRRFQGTRLVHKVASMIDAHLAQGFIPSTVESELDYLLPSTTMDAISAVLLATQSCIEENNSLLLMIKKMERVINVLTSRQVSNVNTSAVYTDEEQTKSYIDEPNSDQSVRHTPSENTISCGFEDDPSQTFMVDTEGSDDTTNSTLTDLDDPASSLTFLGESMIVDIFVGEILSSVRSSSRSSTHSFGGEERKPGTFQGSCQSLPVRISSDDFQAEVMETVSQVLVSLAVSLKAFVIPMNSCATLPLYEAAASNVVETVFKIVKKLLNNNTYQDVLSQDLTIWSVTRDMFTQLHIDLKNFFVKVLNTEIRAKTVDTAKQTISRILLHVKELGNSPPVSVEAKACQKMVHPIFDDAGGLVSQDFIDNQSMASSSRFSQFVLPKWNSQTVTTNVVRGTELGGNSSQMEEMTLHCAEERQKDKTPHCADEKYCSYTCVPSKTIASVTSTINTWLGLESQRSSDQQLDQISLTAVRRGLERGPVPELSKTYEGLVSDICTLLKSGRQTIAASRCASDAGLSSGIPREIVTAQVVGMFAEESTRNVLLTRFKPLSQNQLSQLRQARVSVSCPGGLHLLKGEGNENSLSSQSASQILSEALKAAIEAMVTDVMAILSQTVEPTKNLKKRRKKVGLLEPDTVRKKLTRIQFNPPDLKTETVCSNYADLLDTLTMQLVTMVIGERFLTTNRLTKCQQLSEEVLSLFEMVSGVEKEYPCAKFDTVHIVQRTYDNLISKYGNEDKILMALDTGASCLVKTIVRSFVLEVMPERTTEIVSKPEKAKPRRRFRAPQWMNQIWSFLTRGKMSDKGNCQNGDTEKSGNTTGVKSLATASSEMEDKQRTHTSSSPKKRRSFSSLVRSIFRKRSPAVRPQ